MTKMLIDRSVVEQALEALKDDQDRMVEAAEGHWEYKTDLAIGALKAALAQQAGPVEPVAEARYDGTLRWLEPHGVGLHRIQGPLYTAPPQRKPLTEEEIRLLARDTFLEAENIWNEDTREDLTEFTRAVERAHGIPKP